MAESTGPELKVLAWNEISHAAKMAFAIWSGQPELEWARSAWKTLVRAGLANYRNERERCHVTIRLLALAGLYHDFCAVAWQEYDKPEYVEWAEELGVVAFRVGQLVGGDHLWEAEDDDAAFTQALVYLVNEEREKVLAALLDGFGSVSGLFVSLWRSKTASAGAEAECGGAAGDNGDHESEWEILNDVTTEKLAAFSWLENGCPTINP